MRISVIKPLESARARSALYCANFIFDCAERARLDGMLDLSEQLCNAAMKHFQNSRDYEAQHKAMISRLADSLQRA